MIQDETNNVLKHNSKSANENFLEHRKLIDLCIKKFNPDVFVFCERPPLKNVDQYWDKIVDEVLLHRTIPINHLSRYLFLMLILKM